MAGSNARFQTCFGRRPDFAAISKNGSQNRHAAIYLKRFWVHKSRWKVRYLINSGALDQHISVPIQLKTANVSKDIVLGLLIEKFRI
jgi:hypothetical protein